MLTQPQLTASNSTLLLVVTATDQMWLSGCLCAWKAVSSEVSFATYFISFSINLAFQNVHKEMFIIKQSCPVLFKRVKFKKNREKQEDCSRLKKTQKTRQQGEGRIPDGTLLTCGPESEQCHPLKAGSLGCDNGKGQHWALPTGRALEGLPGGSGPLTSPPRQPGAPCAGRRPCSGSAGAAGPPARCAAAAAPRARSPAAGPARWRPGPWRGHGRSQRARSRTLLCSQHPRHAAQGQGQVTAQWGQGGGTSHREVGPRGSSRRHSGHTITGNRDNCRAAEWGAGSG